jgi:hypothetical protein
LLRGGLTPRFLKYSAATGRSENKAVTGHCTPKGGPAAVSRLCFLRAESPADDVNVALNYDASRVELSTVASHRVIGLERIDRPSQPIIYCGCLEKVGPQPRFILRVRIFTTHRTLCAQRNKSTAGCIRFEGAVPTAERAVGQSSIRTHSDR